MARPAMTDEQRAMAVALLANAIRKEAHLLSRTTGHADDDLVGAVAARRRTETTRQYVRGMRDLLAVLFAGGRAVADECFELAQAQALGEQAEPR